MIKYIAKILYPVLLLAIAASSGCKDESVLSPVVLRDTIYVQKDTVIKAFMIDKIIFPSNPRVGDILKITYKNKPADLYFDYLTMSDLYSDYESVSGDTVVAFWPVLPKMHVIRLTANIWNYNEWAFASASKYLTTDYEVIEGVNVIKSNEPPIERNNYFPKQLRTREHKFTLIEKGDTVIINLSFPVHDEASERMSWKFLNRAGELPKFIQHTRNWNESDGAHSIYYADTLKKGVIKIDKWNEGGVYSGIVYAELEPYSEVRSMRPKTTFWVKRN